MMRRPTCKTCPCWSIQDEDHRPMSHRELLARAVLGDGPSPDNLKFECKRYPRARPLIKYGCDWCGEHPDFPEYVASMKTY